VKNDKEIALKRHLRSFKVMDFVTNGKPLYDFLLMNNSNYSPISTFQRYGDV